MKQDAKETTVKTKKVKRKHIHKVPRIFVHHVFENEKKMMK